MSAGSIDLDINNYTIGELMNFFKLDNNYSIDDLDDKEGELISNILKLYNDTNIVYRNEIIGFIGCKTIETNINDIGIMFFKQFQNRGFGKISLNKFLKIYKTEYYIKNRIIIAKILKTNISSFKIFISNNFKLDEIKTTNEIYFLTYTNL